MKILSTKLLVVALVCLSTDGLFTETHESLGSQDESEKLAQEEAHRHRMEQINEALKKRIMEACQRNIEAVVILGEPYDSDSSILGDAGDKLGIKLRQLLDRTQNLLQLSDNSKVISVNSL